MQYAIINKSVYFYSFNKKGRKSTVDNKKLVRDTYPHKYKG